jgi:hypothetical protein
MNGTHHLLIYVGNENSLGNNKNTMKKHNDLTNASMEDSLEVNTEGTNHTLKFCHQTAGQNDNTSGIFQLRAVITRHVSMDTLDSVTVPDGCMATKNGKLQE